MQAYKIHHFEHIDSTNTYALTHLDSLKDRDVIQGDFQTKGYGRFKRYWISPSSSNIYLSIVLKPDAYHHALVNLTQYMSLVICQILESYDVYADLKWPNDVLVNGAKIAGLLSETRFHGSDLKGFILGVGINLNMSCEEIKQIDQKATSLNLVLNRWIDRDLFIHQILNTFFTDYESVLQLGFKAIAAEYIKRSLYLGKSIQLKLPDQVFEGVAMGLTEDGCLILKLDSGNKKVFTAADVSLF